MRTTEAAGWWVTYRQLDHWIRRGYVHADHDGGTGHARDLDDFEAQVVQVMAALVDLGMRPASAAAWARPLLDDGMIQSGRLQLTLTAPPPPPGPARPSRARHATGARRLTPVT